MEIVDYRITEGSDYMWQCFGPNAYRLDSWNGDQEGHTISILFDTKTQEVFQVEAFDYRNQRAYRLTNPLWLQAFKDECEHRDILDMAWEKDDGTPVNYVDLEVEEDFIEKARAIVAQVDYDLRVQVPLTLDKDQMFELMQMAHRRDMTLNALVEEILRFEIDRLQNA